MTRYQVYLHPSSVAILDQFETFSQVSRSQLIRSAVDGLAVQVAKLIPAKDKPSRYAVFDRMIGSIDLGVPHLTNFSQTVDEIYKQPA